MDIHETRLLQRRLRAAGLTDPRVHAYPAPGDSRHHVECDDELVFDKKEILTGGEALS